MFAQSNDCGIRILPQNGEAVNLRPLSNCGVVLKKIPTFTPTNMVCRGADSTDDSRVAQQSPTDSPTCRRLPPDLALFPAAIGIRYLLTVGTNQKARSRPVSAYQPCRRHVGDHECLLRKHVDRADDEHNYRCDDGRLSGTNSSTKEKASPPRANDLSTKATDRV